MKLILEEQATTQITHMHGKSETITTTEEYTYGNVLEHDSQWAYYQETNRASKFYKGSHPEYTTDINYWFIVHTPTGYTVACIPRKPTKETFKLLNSYEWTLLNGKLCACSKGLVKSTFSSLRNHRVVATT